MTEKKFLFKRFPAQLKTWQREIARQRGKAEALLFMDRVRSKFVELFTHSRSYKPRVLQKRHFENNLLPAIAAYQVLLQEGNDPKSALKILDRLLETGIAGQKRFYKILGRFPFFFDLLRLTLKPMMRLQYPPEGWRYEFPALGRDVVALDGHSCFYLEVLTEYGLPELTRHFCRLDDVLFEGVTPYVRWERTQTLGRGGELCDFRYYRVKLNQG
jgi:hypothetical protein